MSVSPTPALKRKIAAILAADVVGYSRLVAADEERTLHDLAAARLVFDARVARGGGRIFNTAGDSVMCEFDSAVEAVRAAADIQADLAGRNVGLDPGRRMLFRIGITIGDVVERDGDLLGDGVNMAARLESLAEPGGICVSRSVQEAVANKVPVVFRDGGERRVKNIPQPVYAFMIAPPAILASGPTPGELVPDRMAARPRAGAATPRGRSSRFLIGGMLVLALVSSAPAIKLARDSGPAWLGGRGTAERPADTNFQAATNPVEVTAFPPLLVTPPTAPAASSPSDASRPETGKLEAGKPEASKPEAVKPEAVKPDATRAEAPKAAAARPDTPKVEATLPVPRPEKPAVPADATAQFAALARQGRIADATTLPEWYHNARWLEGRGDKPGALKIYAAIAPVASPFIDVELRYAALLRATAGATSARQTFADLARNTPARAVSLAHILQADAEERRERLEAFVAANPDGGVADYLLGEDYMARPGGPTLTERRLAFDAYDRFLEASAAGDLQPAFLDTALASTWLDGARRRRQEIEAVVTGQPSRPAVSFARTESGWLASLTLPEPATAVATRFGERGEFVSTGSLATTDSRTGRPAPNLRVALPAGAGRTTLYTTYTDRSGREAGPFALPFDATGALVAAERDVLEKFPDGWVSFRADLPGVLSISQLLSSRCALKAAFIGYNDGPVNQPLALPPCDERAPSALPADARSVIALPPGIDTVQVKLAYADGTESATRTFRRP